MFEMIVTVCALVGAQAGECHTDRMEVDSLEMCYLGGAIASGAMDKEEATLEFKCIDNSKEESETQD